MLECIRQMSQDVQVFWADNTRRGWKMRSLLQVTTSKMRRTMLTNLLTYFALLVFFLSQQRYSLVIEVPVPSQESEQFWTWVLGVSILTLFLQFFRLDLETIPKVWYFFFTFYYQNKTNNVFTRKAESVSLLLLQLYNKTYIKNWHNEIQISYWKTSPNQKVYIQHIEF
jgi:hypothetical protein